MKKALNIIFLIALASWAVIPEIRAQSIDIDVNVSQPYPRRIIELIENPNQMVIEVRNPSSVDIDVYFQVKLTGLSDDARGLEVTIPLSSFGVNPIPLGTTRRFASQDFPVFYGDVFSDDNYEVIYADDPLRAELQRSVVEGDGDVLGIQGRFPVGSYNLCVQVIDFNSNQPVTSGLDCDVFDVEAIQDNKPIILTPDEFGNPSLGEHIGAQIPEDDDIIFTWTPPMTGMQFDVDYTLEVVTFDNLSEYKNFESIGRPQDYFERSLTPFFQSNVSNKFNYEPWVEDGLLFDKGYYAVRVTATSNSIIFDQDGKSDIVLFSIGQSSEDGLCGFDANDNVDFSGEQTFPISGDTLPFTFIPQIVSLDPICDNFRGLEYGFGIGRKEDGQDIKVDTYLRNLSWPNGPEAYLRNYIRNSAGQAAIKEWLPPENKDEFLRRLFIGQFELDNKDISVTAFERGKSYFGGGKFRIEAESESGQKVLSQPVEVRDLWNQGFHCGMPKPYLLHPQDGALVTSNQLIFRYGSGKAPSKSLPDYKILNIENQRALIPGFFVKEILVLQVSDSADFSRILHSKAKRIEVHPNNASIDFDENILEFSSRSVPNDEDNVRKYDRNLFDSKVFRSFDHPFDLPDSLAKTGSTYFWRVAFASDPLEISASTNLSSLTDDDFYRFSEVRSFRLGESNESDDPGAGNSNDSADCDTECSVDLASLDKSTPEDGESGITAVMENHRNDYELSFQMGHFPVDVNRDDLSISGDEISGKGVVKISLVTDILLKVSFKNVKLNSNGRALEGTMEAIKDEGFKLTDLDKDFSSKGGVINEGMGFINEELKKVNSTATDIPRLLYKGLINNTPLGLPIAVSMDIQGYKVAIGFSEFKFTPERANTNIFTELQLPEDLYAGGGEKYFSLGARDICITPAGFGSEFILHLKKDLVVPLDGKDCLVVKGSEASDNNTVMQESTHLRIDCKDVRSMALRFEVIFPDDVLQVDTAIEKEETKVKGKFALELVNKRESDRVEIDPAESQAAVEDGAEIPDWDELSDYSNFMVSFEMTPFMIKGLDGWGFSLDTGVVDFSTLENPAGMKFPDNYNFGSPSTSLLNTWKGFYIKEISVRAPKDWTKGERHIQSKLEAGFSNIIFDGRFSADIFARNIIEITDGSVNGWAISVDTFDMSFVQNTFHHLNLDGKFKLPIQKEGYLAYDATVGPEEGAEDRWGFVFNVEVKDEPIVVPLFVAEATIREDSYVHLATAKIKGDKRADEGNSFELKGEMNIGGDVEGLDDVMGALETAFNFSGIHYSLKYTQAHGWIEDSCYVSFASPQKYMGGSLQDENENKGSGGMGGFPISISNFTVENPVQSSVDALKNIANNEGAIKTKFGFDIEVNFMDDDDGGISASTSLKFVLGWDLDNSEFILDGVEIGCISLTSEINAVTLEGKVCFLQDAPVCNTTANGVSGVIRVGLPVADIMLKAAFATATPTNGGNSFRYWYVDGKAIMESGISMGTLSLYGLSGGVYYNMEIRNSTSTIQSSPNDLASVKEEDKRQVEYDPNLLKSSEELAGNLKKGSGKRDSESPTESATDVENANWSDIPDSTRKRMIAAAFNDQNSSSGLQFCPKENSFVFKAGLVMGLTGQPSLFNMDVGVTASISSKVGLTYFDITGSGYIMADFDKRNEAKVIADVQIGYQKELCADSEQDYCSEEFFANFAVYVNLNIADLVTVRGVGEEKETIAGIRSYPFVESAFSLRNYYNEDFGPDWYFKMGTPQSPGGVYAKVLNELEARARFYLQVGNHGLQPGFMDPPQLVKDLLSEPSTSGGSADDGGQLDSENISGSEQEGWGNILENAGLENPQDIIDRLLKDPKNASGFGMGFSFDLAMELDFILLYALFEAAAGFDIAIIEPDEGVLCAVKVGEDEFEVSEYGGNNGYYATGQIYAGIKGEIGLKIEFIGTMRISLFELGAAFLVQGGFPNPSWLQGVAAISYSALGGLVSGSSRFVFKEGDVCLPPMTDPFGFAVIEKLTPENGAQNVKEIVEPTMSFNIPMNRRHTIVQRTTEEGSDEIRTELWHLYPYIKEAAILDASGNIVCDYGVIPPPDLSGLRNTTKNKADLESVNEGREAIFLPEDALKEEKYYTFRVKVGAKKSTSGGLVDVQVYRSKDSSYVTWEETAEVRFKVRPMPAEIDPGHLIATAPMPLQKYFFTEESAPMANQEIILRSQQAPREIDEVMDEFQNISSAESPTNEPATGYLLFQQDMALRYFNDDNKKINGSIYSVEGYKVRFTELNEDFEDSERGTGRRTYESKISKPTLLWLRDNKCRDRNQQLLTDVYGCSGRPSQSHIVKYNIPSGLEKARKYRLEIIADLKFERVDQGYFENSPTVAENLSPTSQNYRQWANQLSSSRTTDLRLAGQWRTSGTKSGQKLYDSTGNEIVTEIKLKSNGSLLGEDENSGYEFVMFSTFFQTSAYGTLEEKLDDADIRTEGTKVYINSHEPFDALDLYGLTNRRKLPSNYPIPDRRDDVRYPVLQPIVNASVVANNRFNSWFFPKKYMNTLGQLKAATNRGARDGSNDHIYKETDYTKGMRYDRIGDNDFWGNGIYFPEGDDGVLRADLAFDLKEGSFKIKHYYNAYCCKKSRRWREGKSDSEHLYKPTVWLQRPLSGPNAGNYKYMEKDMDLLFLDPRNRAGRGETVLVKGYHNRGDYQFVSTTRMEGNSLLSQFIRNGKNPDRASLYYWFTHQPDNGTRRFVTTESGSGATRVNAYDIYRFFPRESFGFDWENSKLRQQGRPTVSTSYTPSLLSKPIMGLIVQYNGVLALAQNSPVINFSEPEADESSQKSSGKQYSVPPRVSLDLTEMESLFAEPPRTSLNGNGFRPTVVSETFRARALSGQGIQKRTIGDRLENVATGFFPYSTVLTTSSVEDLLREDIQKMVGHKDLWSNLSIKTPEYSMVVRVNHSFDNNGRDDQELGSWSTKPHPKSERNITMHMPAFHFGNPYRGGLTKLIGWDGLSFLYNLNYLNRSSWPINSYFDSELSHRSVSDPFDNGSRIF